MPFPVDKLIGNMQCPVLTLINGLREYEGIKLINDKLTGNAVVVPTNLRYGAVGYERLTLNTATYDNITTANWVAHVYPGVQAVIPTGSTGPQITELN